MDQSIRKAKLSIQSHVNFTIQRKLFYEEVGWSGYAVDAIEKRWSALTTAISIGFVWTIWHYPSMIQQGRDLRWVVWGTLGTVYVQIVIVWLYNRKAVASSIFIKSKAIAGTILLAINDRLLKRIVQNSLASFCKRISNCF